MKRHIKVLMSYFLKRPTVLGSTFTYCSFYGNSLHSFVRTSILVYKRSGDPITEVGKKRFSRGLQSFG